MFQTIFVQPLFNLLFAIYGFLPGHDFGLAVIALTILVRLAMWPLVSRQLKSQKVMQSLAPEVARVRQEAKGDRQLETQMLMNLYKEKGTSPFAPILPLLIQLPIFFALYIVFRDAVHPDKIASLTYDAVEKIPAVASVIAHNALFRPELLGVVDLTKPNVFLALIAGLAQYYQSRMLQPKQKPQDDQAKIMSSMVIVFPILTFLVGLSLPSALALYWAVTSIVASLQQYMVLRQDAEKMEEEADRQNIGAPHPGPTPVPAAVTADGGATVSAKNGGSGKHKTKGGKRKGKR
jgi:YidC/Oxa1 family membrane protein insertase